MQIIIEGGRVIDPANGIDKQSNVYIADGRIVAIADKQDGFNADQTIDANGKLVIPGLVDLHARLREPGMEQIATIESETSAAVAGGVTTLVCPPDTMPVIDTPAVAELIHQAANRVGKAKVRCIGAITTSLQGKQLSEMHALHEAGCVAVSNASHAIENTLVQRRAMEYAATFDFTVFLSPVDRWLRGDGCAHESALSTRMGLAGIPSMAESIAVARDLALIENTGVRAHFVNLSSRESVRKIARAKYEGLPVSIGVAAHQLHLTDMNISDFNVDCHVDPPLRSQRDRDGLVQGLSEGVISAICSDHQPHDLDAKLGPFAETESGMSGLETLLPLSLRLAKDKNIDLSKVIAAMTCDAANIIKLDAGHLSTGAAADITIVDPDCQWELNRNQLHSRGKNTAFDGWLFDAKVMHTLVDGKLVYSAG